MKKTLFLSALLMPTIAFAQSAPGLSDGSGFGTLIITLVVMVGVFILCRELLCWYWKINTMVKNQDEIIRLLKKIAKEEHSEGSSHT